MTIVDTARAASWSDVELVRVGRRVMAYPDRTKRVAEERDNRRRFVCRWCRGQRVPLASGARGFLVCPRCDSPRR